MLLIMPTWLSKPVRAKGASAVRSRKLFVGAQIRHLREQQGVRQADLARAIGVSASYLNQIEHNRRPLTDPVLARVSEALGLDPELFESDSSTRLLARLREAVADAGSPALPSSEQIRQLAVDQPAIAEAFVSLHRRFVDAREQADLLAGSASAPTSYEEVRDFFYERQNYIDELDRSAEAVALEENLRPGELTAALVERLSHRHQVVVIEQRDEADEGGGEQRRFDRASRTLFVSSHLRSTQQAFQLATQLALLEHRDLINDLCNAPGFTSETARSLARVGLANYFAGAVLLPYGAFRDAAEELRYDVDRLSRRFDVGFESTCHRLSTLQRPRARGVPFSFVRIDRAGNVSKRQSASSFHFSRIGGTCPLWSVYDALASPGRLVVQVGEMPDGRRYLWLARTVVRARGGYGTPGKFFAIGLGCDIRHAHRLIYSAGLDVSPNGPASPIGLGCKVCDRPACAQRAYPPTGLALRVDEHTARFAPYSSFRPSS